mgnify:CR=1 FL=1
MDRKNIDQNAAILECTLSIYSSVHTGDIEGCEKALRRQKLFYTAFAFCHFHLYMYIHIFLRQKNLKVSVHLCSGAKEMHVIYVPLILQISETTGFVRITMEDGRK